MEQINPGLIGKLLIGQDLLGDIDGGNKVFTTSRHFRHDGLANEAFYYNGHRLQHGATNDYLVSESGGAGTGYDTLTLVIAPRVGDVLLIDYYLSH